MQTTPSTSKLSKNQFKCYQCRLIFTQINGAWFDWNHMQVHLCRGCEKVTKQSPERNHAPG